MCSYKYYYYYYYYYYARDEMTGQQDRNLQPGRTNIVAKIGQAFPQPMFQSLTLIYGSASAAHQHYIKREHSNTKQKAADRADHTMHITGWPQGGCTRGDGGRVRGRCLCALGLFQRGHGLRGRDVAAAAVEEGQDVGQVVELGAAPGHIVTHPVVQEAAMRPGPDHQLAACFARENISG